MEAKLERAFSLLSSACGTIVMMIVRRKYNGPLMDVAKMKIKEAALVLEDIP